MRALSIAATAGACVMLAACAAQPPPIRVVGLQSQVRPFAGHWEGGFDVTEDGASGVVTLDLAADDRIAFGDVQITSQLAALGATGVFNLATGTSRTFGSIVDELQTFVPHKFERINQPRKGAITHRQFDIAQLKAALPAFSFTDFSQGLQTTLAAAERAA